MDAFHTVGLVRDPNEAAEVWKDYLRSAPKIVAVDTETTGLEWYADELFLIQVGWGEQQNYVFPAGKRAKFSFVGYLTKILEDPSSAKVFHNCKFDMHFLEQIGIQVKGPILDTQVAARLCFPEGVSLRLKDLAVAMVDKRANEDELALKSWMKEEKRARSKALTVWLKDHKMSRSRYDAIVSGKETATAQELALIDQARQELPSLEVKYSDIPDEIIYSYAGNDTRITLGLYEKLLPILERTGQIPSFQLDMAASNALYTMEKTGFCIDRTYLDRAIEAAQNHLQQLTDELHHLSTPDLNLNSSVQILDVLKQRGLEEVESTDKRILKEYANTDEFIEKLLLYRAYTKTLNTYLLPIRERVLKAYDHRLHGNFNVGRAVTGRLSSSDPNLQNISNVVLDDVEVKRAFVPTPGFRMYSLDYSQQEMVVLAHYSRDPKLVDQIVNGEDLHTNTALAIDADAQKWYTRIKENADDLEAQHHFQKIRKRAKATTFGVIYGIGPEKLAKQNNMTLEEAKSYLSNYFRIYPGVRQFMDTVRSSAELRYYQSGVAYVYSTFGRVFFVPDTRVSYKLVDYLIQGTSAEITKQALIRVDRLFQGHNSRLVGTIHDELLVEMAEDELYLLPEVVKAMTTFPELIVPLRVDVAELTPSWADEVEVTL